MSRKQSHEASSQGTYKISYQVNSPYVELLESKKKVYGHRYEGKANRSFTNYVKPSPVSITSMFNQQVPKSFKSVSTEKVKYGRTSTNEKKKRTKTEAAEDKMH